MTEGTTLTSDYPEKSVTDRDLKYGDGVQSIEHVQSAFTLTLSPGGQESPSATEVVTVSEKSLQRDVSMVTRLESVVGADLVLQRVPTKIGLTQEQQNELKSVVTKYRYQLVFPNKHGLAKGVVHKLDAGDAPPEAVTPYRDTGPYVDKVMQRLKAVGLTVKASKCQLGSPEMKYLGHVVGGGVIKPLEAEVDAISSWPRPTTKKKVRSFLELVGYYRRFIPRFREIAAPLTELTCKKSVDIIQWSSSCEEAFGKLKEALITNPVLQALDFDREFTVFTGASNSGLGAMLCQSDNCGDLHPVAYLSKKLQKGERQLSTLSLIHI